MTKEEILDGIAKTDAVINNSSIPEAVKQVAINKKAELQSKLDAMGGEAPKVEKEEVIEKEVEKEVVAPKKERIKFERKPRTPKAPKKEKEAETESPESKAEKSMEGKTLSVANCRELLAKLKTRREGAKKRVATRKKQGKPAQLTTIEVLKKASDNLEKKVETEVNKDGKLQKTTITRSTKEVVDIVATIVSGIPTKAERTSYINEVIADLKKLIDKVEPITEKMARGGMMADGVIIAYANGDDNLKLGEFASRLEAKNFAKENKNRFKTITFEDDYGYKFVVYKDYTFKDLDNVFSNPYAKGGEIGSMIIYKGRKTKILDAYKDKAFGDRMVYRVNTPMYENIKNSPMTKTIITQDENGKYRKIERSDYVDKMAKGGMMADGGYTGWDMKNGQVTLNGKLVTRYDFDRDADAFFIDSVSGGGQKGFMTKEKVYEYLTENLNLSKYAKGGIFSRGPLEFKDSIQGSDGNYTYNLTFQPRNNISTLYIYKGDRGKSSIFLDINYSIVQSFAQEFQDLMDEYEDEFTETDWSFEGEVKSAFHDDKKYGASSRKGIFTIFIGDKSAKFESGSLMQSLAESFIELADKVGDKGYDDQEYAKGGYMADGGIVSKRERVIDYYFNNDVFDDPYAYNLEEGDLKDYKKVEEAIVKYHGLDNDGNVQERFETLGLEEFAHGGKFAKGGMMADGGMMAEGGFVVISDKDGYWYIMSTPVSQSMAKELLNMTTIPRGEVGKVVTLEEAKNHKKVIGRKYLKMADGGMNQNYEGLEIIIPSSYQNKNKLKGDIEAFIGDDYEDRGNKIFVRNKDVYGHGVTLSKLKDLYEYINNNYGQIEVELFAKGGEIGQELMGGEPNQEKPSGAILLEVRKNGKEIVVTEDDGKTKELYVKSNGFSGYTLRYKGNQYEFAYSLDSYAKGGNVNYRKNWEVTYITLQGTKGKKVITLGRMSDEGDVKNQLKRMDLNIREVTSIKEIGMMAKGGKITRNKNKNDYNSMFNFFIENNYQPIGKRDLINMAYESSNGIDSAIPQSMVGDVDNTAYYVYDYQTDKMGELVDLRMKLKFSDVKVDVTIVQDGELKYRDELPSELQNATFHQALNYVFMNDDVEQFAIRPKK